MYICKHMNEKIHMLVLLKSPFLTCSVRTCRKQVDLKVGVCMRGVCRGIHVVLLAHPAVCTQGCQSRVAATTQFHILDYNSEGVFMLLGTILSLAQSCCLHRQ